MFFVLKNVVRLVVSLIFLSPIIVPLLVIERKPLVSEADQQTFDGIGDATSILKRFDPDLFYSIDSLQKTASGVAPAPRPSLLTNLAEPLSVLRVGLGRGST